LEYEQVIDVGSGDGRIAYCSKFLGLSSFSFEIDPLLVDLQNKISKSTDVSFHPSCVDATSLDYSSLKLTRPVFFIGGLAQMGGAVLSTALLENIQSDSVLMKNAGMIFVGTTSQKYASDPLSEYGWGTLIHKYGLKVMDVVILPTVWTFKEHDDTPYIFAKSV